jgi:hypothetical protein
VATLKLNLEGGRRTTLAMVPPPAPRKAETKTAARSPDKVYDMLRMMSDPVYSGMNKQAMMGGAAPAGSQLLDTPPPVAGEELIHQNKLTADDAPHTGAEIMGRAVVASDRSKITVHVAPVFQTASDRSEVKLSAIPGGQ